MSDDRKMLAILLAVFLVEYSTACVEWTLKNTPVIFGKTAELSCLIETNKSREIRTWLGGKDYKTLTTDGAPSDPKKYGETSKVHGTRVESILQIFKFNENDVNWDYACSIEADKSDKRKKLALKPGDFEMHPTKVTSTVLAVFRNNHLDVIMKLTKVYPEPKCKVMFNEVEIIKRVSTTTGLNGIFYTITERLQHTFSRNFCSGRMTITCLIGTTNVKIHDEKFYNCKRTDHAYKLNLQANVIVPVIIGCIMFISVVVALACIARYGNLRSVLCCNFLTWREQITIGQSRIAHKKNKTDNVNPEEANNMI